MWECLAGKGGRYGTQGPSPQLRVSANMKGAVWAYEHIHWDCHRVHLLARVMGWMGRKHIPKERVNGMQLH